MSDSASPPACPDCQARDQRIARLEQLVAQQQGQIEQLRQQLDEAQRAGKRQAAPFRRPGHKANPKKPGRPKGHTLAVRPRPEHIDRTLEAPCDTCPDCHVGLVDKVVHQQYQTDLPPVLPLVTQFNIHGGTCPCCKRYHQGRHPEMTSDAIGACANQIGPVALSMAAELKHRLGVPYRKVADFFATYFGLLASPGTLTRAERRLAKRARPTFDLLLQALRLCGVVHGDETGWRISRVNAWLWVFSSATVTIYAIRTSRGHEVPEEVLGTDFAGVLVVDGWAAYDVLECKKGRCIGHIVRRARHLLEQGPKACDARHLNRLLEILRAGLELAGRYPELAEADYRRQMRRWEDGFNDWLLIQTRRAGPEVQRLRNHLNDHQAEFMRFLLQPGVPATNNHAERMLRPAVISRKVGGCNKTLLGALVHEVLASLLVSVRQQGKRFLDLALRLWRSTDAEAIDLGSLPEASGTRPAVVDVPLPGKGGMPAAYAPSG